jgi:hypothetical protein
MNANTKNTKANVNTTATTAKTAGQKIYDAVVHNVDNTGKLETGICFQTFNVVNPSFIPGKEKRFIPQKEENELLKEIGKQQIEHGKVTVQKESIPFVCVSLAPVARTARAIDGLGTKLFKMFVSKKAALPCPPPVPEPAPAI